MTYRILLFADFTERVDNYTQFDFLLFVPLSFFMLVVIMNLAISIISDTHDKAQNIQEINQRFQQCRLTFDLEALTNMLPCIYRDTKTDTKEYLISAEVTAEETTSEWSGRVSEITNAVKKSAEKTD